MDARSAAMVMVVSGKSFSYTGSKMVLNTCCDDVAWPMRSRPTTSTARARLARMKLLAANTVEDPVTPPVLMRRKGLAKPSMAVRSTDTSPLRASGATPESTMSMPSMSMPASASARLAAS